MRKITSIKNAIKYFEEGSKKKTNRTCGGDEYVSIVPPVGFRRLNISEYFYDTRGNVAGLATQIFHAFQWKDYADIIRKRESKIVKLVLYYE